MHSKVFRISAMILAVICLLTCAACGQKENNTEMSYESIYEQTATKYADVDNPVAVIVMEDGSAIAVELYADLAVNTVRNFISLANSGYYDGVIFHRVIDGFMIQGGDPTGTGFGGPGYQIFGEFNDNGYKNDLSHQPGVISMAREGNRYYPQLAYNTAGSQFFICVADDSYSLDNQYAAFGMVLDGMDTVYSIAKTATDTNDRPVTEQKMAYVRVDTHGITYPEPETIAE